MSILLFLVIFSVVVISHEFGHFIIARANGIHVVEFYVGFGPTLFSVKKGGTTYSVKLLPLGGACVFENEDGLEAARKQEASNDDESASTETEVITEDIDKEESKYGVAFYEVGPWARLATVLAGPVFNVILGFIVAFIMVNLIIIRTPEVTDVIENSPAEAAGLQSGDKIISLNGSKIHLYDDIALYDTFFEGGDILVVYEREGKTESTVLTPYYDEQARRYMLGISNSSFLEDVTTLDRFKYTWYEVSYNFRMTWGSLKMLVRGRVKSEDVSGPVGIAVNVVGETYEQTKEYGWETVFVNMLNIALMLTINLGILNLLPIPALDGGRLVFCLIEIIRGKPVPREKEAFVHMLGMLFFLALIVFVFFNDIRNVFFK